jgi:uncharacterized protein
MQVIDFKSPRLLFEGHLQTIIPSLFRKIKGLTYHRERLDLPDGDFVDLDWAQSKKQQNKLVILTHGLEGDSTRHYVMGMVKKFVDNGWDGLAWNCRSCSGEINRLPRFYHHGDASDLRFVAEYAVAKGYEQVALVGFSMGGSLTLRSVAEFPEWCLKQIVGVAAFSVPLDLPTSVYELYKPTKRFYMNRFLKKLGVKIKKKAEMYPKILSYEGYENIKNFEDFDNKYTAPLHGFDDANSFYALASVKPHLHKMPVPALIGQAINDPFLTPECLEINDAAAKNSNLKLVLTSQGGHVGFIQRGAVESFAEQLAFEFIQKLT